MYFYLIFLIFINVIYLNSTDTFLPKDNVKLSDLK